MTETLRGPGSTIGAYELLAEIGRGGLGVVYRSRHVHLGRLAALKVLHPLWTTSQEFVERFREEGRLMALLEHPNILRVYDAGEDGGLFFLATAYHEGQTLEAVMREPVPVDTALLLTRQIARALAYAHRQGIVHRDVKPANVMVSAENRVTLMDFGVARLKDAPGVTLPGIRVGTPYYMAPEQILGKRVDGRVDVYALGVILHQILTGQLPFPGPTTEEVFDGHVHREVPELDPRLPNWLRDAARKALAKDPSDRFQDAETFFRALDPSATRPAIPAPAAVPVPPAPTPAASAGAPASTAGSTGPRTGPLVREQRTALSLDVVGSARMKHPGLTQVIQEQFAQFRAFVRRLLEKHGCLDSVWSGDGLLALFTRPADGVACGLEILEGLNDPANSGAAPIRVRIGVHHGPLLMAEGTPLGEVMSRTLDTAGHLQKSCPENNLLISEGVFVGLADQADWGPAPSTLQAFQFPVFQHRKGVVAAVGSATPAAGCLKLQVTSKGQVRALELTGEALIGRPDPASRRVPEIDVRHDDAVSRRHARIFPGEGGFLVEDLGSANGTSLNGRWLEPSKPTVLRPGDQVEVGETTVIRVLPAG
ncbi:MAG: serine/threonine protein kinase with sensor(s) [Armatimonadetes bacterium]|jgi:class 3 adenylate cyclase|nr:serine/threonine protein kinase with sensor(s) [Armatimonadota bacterium]